MNCFYRGRADTISGALDELPSRFGGFLGSISTPQLFDNGTIPRIGERTIHSYDHGCYSCDRDAWCRKSASFVKLFNGEFREFKKT